MVAVLAYLPQLDAPVALVTWTLATPPGARSPKLQASVWLPALPVIWQALAGAWPAMLQLTPLLFGPPGSGSLIPTLVAVPVPWALALLTERLNPIDVPALTGVPSALLPSVRLGHKTVAVAEAVSELLVLVAERLAVLA
jgi:hypothetical protein